MHFYLIVTRSCKKTSKARSHKMLGDVKISLNLSQLKATDFFAFIFG